MKIRLKDFRIGLEIFHRYLALIFETQGKYDQAAGELEKIPSLSARKKAESLKRRKAAPPHR